MNLNNVVQIDKDCYSIRYKNDLKDLNYMVNTGSHVHCLEDDNTYVYLGENRWGSIKNKDSGSSEGSDLITETLQVTANGIYNAPEGKAYDQIEVEVSPVLDELVVTENGSYIPPLGVDGFNEITVNVPSSSNSSAPEKDVNFIDYDGTITNSYTAAEFSELTAMPANLSHNGLTSQGWNWSLSDAQAYVAKYGKLNVGQMYITDDGKTRIYIHLEEGRLAPYLGLAINGTVDIDWGDGSEHSVVTGTSTTTVINTQHAYATAGDYVIIIDVTGSMTLSGHSNRGSRLLWNQGSSQGQNQVYQNTVRRVEIGNNITIKSNAFRYCNCLSSITIPNSVTSIEDNTFDQCRSLSSITIPNSVTTIGSNVFSACYNLSSIIIPNSVTTIGSSTFMGCYSILSVIISDSVTTIGGSAFSNCASLMNIIIPDSVTTIETNMIGTCFSLTSIIIPNSVTTIGTSAFSYCYGLSSVTIPDSVTAIKGNAFTTCGGLSFIRFESTIPPTVANSNAFSNLSTDCIIYVPAGTLSDYTSATNYPSSSTYTYVEY